MSKSAIGSNLGKWDRWFSGLSEEQSFGDTTTYEIGAEFLSDCSTVADWGCGKGWFSKYIDENRYIGIDGSKTPFAGVIADLTTYSHRTEGVFLRHVLEHNYEWRKILQNAVDSFTKKLVLVLFTPIAGIETEEIAYTDDLGVPDISFAEGDIESFFKGFYYQRQDLETATQYGCERVYLVRRNKDV